MDKIKDRKYQIRVRMGSKLEISCTASGRLNVTTTVQISLGGSSKLNTQILYDQTVHLLGIRSTETHISMHWKYIQHVYGSVICNRQNMETTQIPINSGMNGLWSYVSFKVLHSNKDAQITAKHNNADRCHKHHVQKITDCVLPLLSVHKEGNSAMVMEVDGGYSWANGVTSGCSARRLLSF